MSPRAIRGATAKRRDIDQSRGFLLVCARS
jgi:hypothetical protein